MTATLKRPRRPRRFRAVALVAIASLSCATVRAPAGGIPPSVEIRGDVPEPQVELWVESGEQVSPEEATSAAADARAALEAALAGRLVSEGEQMLVVRAQGVSRTASRRSDQHAAVAGIVIGAVAVVAIVVVLLVASEGKGGLPAGLPGGGGPRPSGSGGARIPPVPIPVSGPRPAPPPAVVAGPPRPSGGAGGPRVAIGVGADVHVGIPAPPDGAPPPALLGHSVVEPPGSVPQAVERVARAEIRLAPPPPLDVSKRSFFAKDATRLELTLVDRASLAPLWVKTVEAEVDLRDVAAVRALLDRALDDPAGWQPAQAPAS